MYLVALEDVVHFEPLPPAVQAIIPNCKRYRSCSGLFWARTFSNPIKEPWPGDHPLGSSCRSSDGDSNGCLLAFQCCVQSDRIPCTLILIHTQCWHGCSKLFSESETNLLRSQIHQGRASWFESRIGPRLQAHVYNLFLTAPFSCCMPKQPETYVQTSMCTQMRFKHWMFCLATPVAKTAPSATPDAHI